LSALPLRFWKSTIYWGKYRETGVLLNAGRYRKYSDVSENSAKKTGFSYLTPKYLLDFPSKQRLEMGTPRWKEHLGNFPTVTVLRGYDQQVDKGGF